MAKANAEATAERVDHLQGMMLAGEPNTLCRICATKWGVSRAQGYRLLKKAWALIKDDIEESAMNVGAAELVNQMLMAATGQAMKQNNPGLWLAPSVS